MVKQHLTAVADKRSSANVVSKPILYEPGDRVWVRDPQSARSKFDHPWIGPYDVVNQTGPTTYLCRRKGAQKLEVINAERIKPYNDPHVLPCATDAAINLALKRAQTASTFVEDFAAVTTEQPRKITPADDEKEFQSALRAIAEEETEALEAIMAVEQAAERSREYRMQKRHQINCIRSQLYEASLTNT